VGRLCASRRWFRNVPALCATAVVVSASALPVSAQTRADRLERGRYLVETIGVCGHCHTPQKLHEGRQVDLPGMHLAGGYGFDNPVLGRWVGANITSDPETGIGSWTEGQIATAIREGKRPDGSTIGPPMPFAHLRKISDADVSAMATYLKSVPSVRHAVERPSYRITLPANWGPPVSGQAGPPDGDPTLRGAYLAEVGHCMDCHTPNRPGGGRDWSRTGAGAARPPAWKVRHGRQRHAPSGAGHRRESSDSSGRDRGVSSEGWMPRCTRPCSIVTGDGR